MVIMSNPRFYYIQEGLHVSKNIKETFELKGNDLSGKDNSKCNFTGIVIKGNDILIAWPKNFFAPEDVEQSKDGNPKLLFDILVKYMNITEESYLNDDDRSSLQGAFPLKAFKNILSYYLKYGLYSEENIVEQQGYVGKIDWKNTIVKSNKVISEGKLLYLPFTIRKRYFENVFISECMAYVINETYALLSFILGDRRHVEIDYNRDLFLNKVYVLSRLKSFKGKIFKDINKRLLNDLINFFEAIDDPSEFIYKNYYFSSIWEAMVGEFLNRNLSYIDREQHRYKSKCKLFKFDKQKFNIGNRDIEVDHYFETETHIYILDSKYYQTVHDLNYKQVAYDYFLRKENKQIVNALIAPYYEDKVKNHISFDKDRLYITEHYLNLKTVMKDCARN